MMLGLRARAAGVALAALIAVAGLCTAGWIPTGAAVTVDDWSTSLHDLGRSAASSDTTLSPSVAPTLTRIWSFQTGGPVATSPDVVSGIAYFGSWDGYEYAVNASSGALVWKTYVGQTDVPSQCSPSGMIGVSSPATVLNGVVYLGGGDGYFYALDASTGAVLWRVWVSGSDTPGQYDGHYDWAGALVVNGYAYVGVASLGDCPLIQGQLLQVSLSSHTIVNTLNIVPNGEVGGGIWTSPAYDSATNTIFADTGTEGYPAPQPWSQALLAIDATSLEVTGSWKLPASEAVTDSDFGTSTTLFTDSSGTPLVEALDKNGTAYAFDRSDLAAGPVWQQQVARGGECPTCGQGSVASSAFGGGSLYMAGGTGSINGVGEPGTVRAVDPATGSFLWQHAAPGVVIGALSYDNGMVLDGGGPYLEVLDATTGQRLYSYNTGSQIYAGPSTSDGVILVGNIAGQVQAFAEPAAPPPPPPADANCPSGFTCQDIGSPTPAGSESVSGGTWTVSAGGPGVGGTQDSFRLLSEPTSGDVQIAGQVSSAPSGSQGQAGVMVRQSNDPGAPFYAVLAHPGSGGIQVLFRTSFGGPTTSFAASGSGLPLYLMIQRAGDGFQAATSENGSSYTLVPGTSTSLPLPAVSLAGVAVASGSNGTAGTATLSAVTISAPGTAPSPAPSASPCPTGWNCQDVGNPALVGDQSLSSGTWTVKGSGQGTGGTSDQLHLVSQPVGGDVTLSAQVTGQSSTQASAQTGVMLRAGTDPGSAYYGAWLTPSQGIQVSYRDTDGIPAAQLANPTGSAPAWLEVARSGDTFTTYTSSDGSTWAPVIGSTIVLPNLAGTLQAGLAVSSTQGGALDTATLQTVSLMSGAPASPNACPSGFTCRDVGYPAIAGSQYYNAATQTWTVQGAGNDISGGPDQFRFISQAQTADGSVSAQVNSQAATDPWAKSGVMVRLSDSPYAPYYAALVTPNNGVAVEYRSVQGGGMADMGGSGVAPIWLQVTRSGTTFTAYASSDGVNWTLVPGSGVSIPALTGSLEVGLVVCSHNPQVLGTALFAGVSITGTGAGGFPGPWSDSDIGGATPTGSASYTNQTFTISGGGADIWGSTDQFNYLSQPLSGDTSIVARVTSQTPTDPWARAGVMIKQSTAAGSPYALVAITPGNGLVFQYGFSQSISAGSYSLPNAWVRLDRVGNLFLAYWSKDGFNWVRFASATVAMPNPAMVGLVVSSHSQSTLSTGTFDSVAVIPSGGGPLPAPWSSSDVGSPALPGSSSYQNGVFTLNGAGADIWGSDDQFQYSYQTLAGDGSITARVLSQTPTDPWAKAGVMIKQSASPGSPYALVAVTPGNGVNIETGFDTNIAGGGYSYPVWVRLTRTGSTLTGYSSADGATWTAIGSVTVSVTSPVTIGLFVTSRNATELSTVSFDNVAVVTAGGPLPSPWSATDVGSPSLAGSSSYQNGVFTVSGSGTDIWGTADQFQYVDQTLTADGSITARVTSQSDTDPWAKAGLMVKQSTTAGSSYALLAVTPGNGVNLQSGFSTHISGGGSSFPTWLRLTKVGGTLTGYTSPDGATWTEVGAVSVSLTSPATIGLFVTAHNAQELSTATFDNVTVAQSQGNPVPSPWSSADVGSPTLAGSASYQAGVFTVNGEGTDIWGTADQFHYVYQTLASDASITARVTSQTNTSSWAKAGVMIKQSTTAGSAYTLLGVTPGNGVAFQWGYSSTLSGGSYSFPNAWLRLVRSGSTITAYTSSDGTTWTSVGSTSVSLTDPVTVGLFVTSHNGQALSTATFDNVLIVPLLPSPWSSTDVGSPTLAGSASYQAGVFTVNGEGTDIWGTADQFHYVYQTLSADATITARVTSQTNKSSWAKAGVMIKQSTTTGSAYALLGVTPGNGATFQWGYSHSLSGGSYSFPNAWLRLVRSGSAINAYTSSDGNTWTLVGSTSVNLIDPVTIGLFVTSHNTTALSTATFDNVSVTSGALPSPWTSTPIGTPPIAGSASYQGGVFTVSGSGSDIWGSNDQFHYVDQTLSGNATITARVTSQTDTSSWAKAGVMIKQSTTAGSAYALLGVTPGNGVTFQWGYSHSLSGGSYSFPNAWLRLVRAGGTISAYTSNDGTTWILVGSTSVSLTDPVTIGLFVTSHSTAALSTATFDTVSVTSP